MDQRMAGGLKLLHLLLLINNIMSTKKLFILHDAKGHAIAAHKLLGCTGLSGRSTELTALQRQRGRVAESAGGAASQQPAAQQGAGAGRHGAPAQPGHPICEALLAFKFCLRKLMRKLQAFCSAPLLQMP